MVRYEASPPSQHRLEYKSVQEESERTGKYMLLTLLRNTRNV